MGLSKTSPLPKEEAENINQTPKHAKHESGNVFNRSLSTKQTFEDVNNTSEKTLDQQVSKNMNIKTDQENALALLGKNVLIDHISKKEQICKDEVGIADMEKQMQRKNALDVNHRNEYYCNSCNFKCYALYDLKKHKYSHGGKQFSCDLCKYNSPSMGEVSRHKKRRHSEKTVSCDQCKFVTYQISFLKAHMRSKHQDISYPCPKCNLTLISAGGLRRHEQRIHLGVAFTCQECGQKFSTRERLKEHVEAVHEGVTFACEVLGCEYITSRKFNMQNHMKKTHASSQSTADGTIRSSSELK